MKRNFYALGLMLAATFTLTNCTKEFENPSAEPEGVPFEIIASTVDTKTANDGMSTKWVADDAINLFHAVAGTTTYGTNDKFTITSENLAANKFTGELTEGLASGNYDWYALYPYNDKIATPGDKTVGYTYIGYSSGLNQTGYNSMASLKNSVCPLYGVAKAVPADETPDLTMEHLSSVVAIKVTNANVEPLTVTTASFTATEDIVGSYFIDITKTPVAYTAKTAYETATVTVTSGATPLAKGESATLYLAIKPFKAASGKKLTLSVNGYSKEITLTKDVTFSAGKIKTLNFSYNKPADPTPVGTTATLTFDVPSKRVVSNDTKQVWTENNITLTYNKADYNNNLVEYENPVRFYANTTITVEAPGNITKIEFACNNASYATALNNSITGSTISGSVVSVNCDGSSSTSDTYKMGAQVRMNSITVTYSTDGYVPPVLESIAVSGEYKTEFTQGSEFSFGGVVTATYDDASTKIVTNDCTFTGYDMNVTGNQTVTVTYEGKTATYNITVNPAQSGGGYSVIKSVAELSAGTYLMGGNNQNKYADGTMYMWSDASSVSGQKLKTSPVNFSDGNFDSDVSSYVHIELIATATNNVYYIKLGAKYLKGAEKVWSLVNSPVEWTFADMGGTKDGMYFYNVANNSYVFINSTSDAIRTYGSSNKYKGIYLFKAN